MFTVDINLNPVDEKLGTMLDGELLSSAALGALR